MRPRVLAVLLAVAGALSVGCPAQQKEMIQNAERESLFGPPRNISRNLLSCDNHNHAEELSE
jgi:hypothetical protein